MPHLLFTKSTKGLTEKFGFKEETKEKYKKIIHEQGSAGAEGIVLGCTEIPILIKPGDVFIPVFDTTYLHSRAAVDFALGQP